MRHYKDVNGKFFGTESDIPEGCVEVTIAEINAANALIAQATFNALPYGVKRSAEYPPMSDYLDAVVKGDAVAQQAYIDACLAVKAKYPKVV